MRKIISTSAAVLALAGVTVAAAPADARHYGGYGGYGRGYHGGYGYRGGYGYGRGRGYGGVALGAGLLGLAAGAAIASDRGYYGRGYGYAYAPPPPPPGYYGYDGGCHSEWRWDGYADRYVRVRFCD